MYLLLAENDLRGLWDLYTGRGDSRSSTQSTRTVRSTVFAVLKRIYQRHLIIFFPLSFWPCAWS